MIDLPTSKIEVTQPDIAGGYVDGRYVPGETEIVFVNASVQPLKASEIKMLPEGRRNVESIKIYTELKMFVTDEKNNKKATKVLYDGKNYEVHMVENWAIGTDIKHYKVVALKIDGEGGGSNA